MPIPNPRPTAEDRIRAALWFAERGFGGFSVWSTDDDGTCRCRLGRSCDQPGKHPIPPDGFKSATTDPARIRAMLLADSAPNWGMIPPEGVFILDVDGDGIAHLAELEARLGPLPPTLRTNTAHGQHIFLRWPDGHPRPIGQMFGYVTRWGSGSNAGYVIGPRSVHATGAIYAPAGPVLEVAELPEAWAIAAVAPPADGRPDDEIKIHGEYQLPEPGYTGERYGAIRDFVASRYMRGIPREEILDSVIHTLAPRFAEPLSEAEIRSRFDRAWKRTGERLGPPRAPEPPKRPRITGGGMDAADLLELDLPPLRWLVPDLIPEGTTILAAPPKVGKSCLVYQVAVEAAIGGDLLGRRVTPGSVLYLALEDGKRRGQDRLRTVLAGRTMPVGRLEVRWDANQIGNGLEDDIKSWLDDHGDAVMVAIDTLGKVRPRSTGKQGAYEVDVQDLARLQDLFRDRPVALVIVHHARKEASDDFLASVSGTYGVTGSADTIIVLRRKRLEAFGTVLVTGRDIPDAEQSVRFADGLWEAAPGVLSAARFERAEVYEVIRRRGPVYAKAIADELGKERSNVQHIVERLVADGAVTKVTGGYSLAEVVIAEPARARNTPSHSSHSESDLSDGVTGVTRDTRASTPWLHPCRRYSDHGTSHRQTLTGWTCDACYPEETT